MAINLVPHEDFLRAAFGFLGVDGPSGGNHFFLVSCKGLMDKGDICITEEKLGKRQVLQAGKEGLMCLKREALASIPYKGCGVLRCIGRVKIDEIVSGYAEQGALDILAGEDDALNEVRHGPQFIGVIDGWIGIVSEGHIEAVWTLPIEPTEAGLIEKEEHGGSIHTLRVNRIEARTSPVIEGFLRGRSLVKSLWAAIQHLWLMGAGAHIGVHEPL